MIKIIDGIEWAYLPLLKGALRFKTIVIIVAIVLLGAAGFTFSRMGGEFVPQLPVKYAMQALIRPGSGLSERLIDVSTKIENLLLDNFPEIKTAVARENRSSRYPY